MVTPRKGPICLNEPDCTNLAYGGNPGYCSRKCRDKNKCPCQRGCLNPDGKPKKTHDGQPGYCSRKCRDQDKSICEIDGCDDITYDGKPGTCGRRHQELATRLKNLSLRSSSPTLSDRRDSEATVLTATAVQDPPLSPDPVEIPAVPQGGSLRAQLRQVQIAVRNMTATITGMDAQHGENLELQLIEAKASNHALQTTVTRQKVIITGLTEGEMSHEQDSLKLASTVQEQRYQIDSLRSQLRTSQADKTTLRANANATKRECDISMLAESKLEKSLLEAESEIQAVKLEHVRMQAIIDLNTAAAAENSVRSKASTLRTDQVKTAHDKLHDTLRKLTENKRRHIQNEERILKLEEAQHTLDMKILEIDSENSVDDVVDSLGQGTGNTALELLHTKKKDAETKVESAIKARNSLKQKAHAIIVNAYKVNAWRKYEAPIMELDPTKYKLPPGLAGAKNQAVATELERVIIPLLSSHCQNNPLTYIFTVRLMAGGDDQIEQWNPPSHEDFQPSLDHDSGTEWSPYSILKDDLEMQEGWLYDFLRMLNRDAVDLTSSLRYTKSGVKKQAIAGHATGALACWLGTHREFTWKDRIKYADALHSGYQGFENQDIGQTITRIRKLIILARKIDTRVHWHRSVRVMALALISRHDRFKVPMDKYMEVPLDVDEEDCITELDDFIGDVERVHKTFEGKAIKASQDRIFHHANLAFTDQCDAIEMQMTGEKSEWAAAATQPSGGGISNTANTYTEDKSAPRSTIKCCKDGCKQFIEMKVLEKLSLTEADLKLNHTRCCETCYRQWPVSRSGQISVNNGRNFKNARSMRGRAELACLGIDVPNDTPEAIELRAKMRQTRIARDKGGKAPWSKRKAAKARLALETNETEPEPEDCPTSKEPETAESADPAGILKDGMMAVSTADWQRQMLELQKLRDIAADNLSRPAYGRGTGEGRMALAASTGQDDFIEINHEVCEFPDSGVKVHHGKMALHDMTPSEIFIIKDGKLVKTTIAEQLDTYQHYETALTARTREKRDAAILDTGASIFLLPVAYGSTLEGCKPSEIRISQATGVSRKSAQVTGRAHTYFPGKQGKRGVSITMQAHTMQGLNRPLFSVHGLLKTKQWRLCLDYDDDGSYLQHKRDPSLVIPIYWTASNNCWEIIFSIGRTPEHAKMASDRNLIFWDDISDGSEAPKHHVSGNASGDNNVCKDTTTVERDHTSTTGTQSRIRHFSLSDFEGCDAGPADSLIHHACLALSRVQHDNTNIDKNLNISDLFTKPVTAKGMDVVRSLPVDDTDQDLPPADAKFDKGCRDKVQASAATALHLEGVSCIGIHDGLRAGRGESDREGGDVNNIIRALSGSRGLSKRTVIGQIVYNVVNKRAD